MLEMGALGAMMSGSGPTVFGICRERETAENIAAAIRKEEPADAVFVTGFVKGVVYGS